MARTVAVNEAGLRIGADHGNARYTNAQVDEVLALRDGGMSYGQIVKQLDMPKSTVANICKGFRRCQTPAKWKTLKD